MNSNLKLIYEKKNITETEQQLMNKLLETDFDKVVNKAAVGKYQSDEVPVLESILKAYKNDNETFLFVTYSNESGLGVTCVCIPNQLLEDEIREETIDALVEKRGIDDN